MSMFSLPSLSLLKFRQGMAHLPSWLISWLAQLYLRREKNRVSSQTLFLRKLLRKTVHTAYGQAHSFATITSYEEFAQAVPINSYDTLYPRIERALAGEKHVLYPGKTPRFATSSGTTGKGKYIPVTYDSLRSNHFWWGTRLLLGYLANNPGSWLYTGYGLVIGGWFMTNPLTGEANVGFISAILQHCSPWYAKLMKQPKPKISYIADRQSKVDKIIATTRYKNITSISGQPSWCSAFLQKVVEQTGVSNILELRPQFELVIWWGMAKTLYDHIYQTLLPSDRIQYYQVYNASEWFFAVQDRNGIDDMLLLIDHAVFYEFIPLGRYHHGDMSVVLPLEHIEIGEEYVILITNNAGLYRYILGDTVVFTAREPYRLRVSGRTKYHIDIVGECSTMDHIQTALTHACTQTWASIKDYTVWPSDFVSWKKWAYHFVIERTQIPADMELFTHLLDDVLGQANSYYYDERYDTDMLAMPHISSVRAGTFYERCAQHGKLGGQHKIPRVSNDRGLVGELLAIGGLYR